jgi:hypothetical protein
MDSHLEKNIEFKIIPSHKDVDDLSQECTAYMKTKQFMAKRIYQQQEEIEALKQNIIFHSGKHIEMYEMLKNMNEQMDLVKESLNIQNIVNYKGKENFDLNMGLSHEDIATSFICEGVEVNNFESPIKNKHKKTNFESPLIIAHEGTKQSSELSAVKNENIELKKEIERLKIQLLDQTLDMNRVKTDKFILFNELNELISSLRRVDIDKLNNFVKTNVNNKPLNYRFDMPISKGVKYNILSAQCQIGKILKSDSITRKLNKIDEDTFQHLNLEMCKEGGDGKNKGTEDSNEKIQMEVYHNLLKKTEEEFDAMLDRKLAKRSKSYTYY